MLRIFLTAECRAVRRLGGVVVPRLGRVIQVLGVGKWVFLGCFCPFSPSRVLSMETAYDSPGTADSVSCFPSL